MAYSRKTKAAAVIIWLWRPFCVWLSCQMGEPFRLLKTEKILIILSCAVFCLLLTISTNVAYFAVIIMRFNWGALLYRANEGSFKI